MILALDCATKTGWALVQNGKVLESGVEDFSKRRGESNGMMFLRFRCWLKETVDRYDIGLVVYEMPHYRGGAATEICVNLTGRVQEVCARSDIDYEGVHSMTIKKYATGKGTACKDAMVRAAASILGRAPLDDNEADAVLLAKYAYDTYVTPMKRRPDGKEQTSSCHL